MDLPVYTHMSPSRSRVKEGHGALLSRGAAAGYFMGTRGDKIEVGTGETLFSVGLTARQRYRRDRIMSIDAFFGKTAPKLPEVPHLRSSKPTVALNIRLLETIVS